MSVDRFPGNLRIGVLNERVSGVQEPGLHPIQPKQILLVLLSGCQRFRIDGQEFRLTARRRPQALMIKVARPAALEYLENEGDPLKKVALFTDPDWLDRASPGLAPLADAGFCGHLSHRLWAPSPALVEVAAELVRQAGETHGRMAAAPLLRMARGIELYRLALEDLAKGADPQVQTGRDHPKIAAMQRFVDRHLADPDLDPAALARGCGMGLRSLQRLCRDRLGCGLADFIRQQRFGAALSALQNDRVTVAQAAFIAGYSSPANFSTAFKRAFGVPPGAMRRG